MRSRYAAFVVGRVDYIKESTHPRERRGFDVQATRAWSEQSEWKGLSILGTRDGGEGDNRGTVEFVARYSREDEDVEHHEVASFKKTGGRWYFMDGRMVPKQPARRTGPKVGRNDPCPCGSGKKYKKCCGGA
jgi:SEC-C motif-containing protein